MHPILLALLVLALLAVVLLGLRPLRRAVLSAPIFNMYRKVLPQMSDTERDALEAGTVWWEGELFRGRPDWSRLHAYPRPRLSDDEQRFLDNQAEEACRMVNDWEVTQERFDLPADVWNYLKSQGFLGMIIPKSYGGLGFSAYAHSEIVTAVDPLVGAGRVGHGAELAGPGRAAAALRHRCAEESLSAAPARGEEVPASR